MPLFEAPAGGASSATTSPQRSKKGTAHSSSSYSSSSSYYSSTYRRRPVASSVTNASATAASLSSSSTSGSSSVSNSTLTRSTLLGWGGGGGGGGDTSGALFSGGAAAPGSPSQLKTITTRRVSTSTSTKSERKSLLTPPFSAAHSAKQPLSLSASLSLHATATRLEPVVRGADANNKGAAYTSVSSAAAAAATATTTTTFSSSSAATTTTTTERATAAYPSSPRAPPTTTATATATSLTATMSEGDNNSSNKVRRRRERREERRKARGRHETKDTKKPQSISAYLSSTGHELMGVNQVNKTFPLAANLSLLCYLVLLGIVYSITPRSEWNYLPETERQAAAAAFWILLVSDVLVLTKLLFQRNWRRHTGGIVYACFVCHAIAIATNLLLAYAPSIVMVDPYTHSRVFLVRWCEWIPLAGLKTYFSEGVGISKEANGFKLAVLASLAQSVSCVSGIVFPFCKDLTSWCFWLFNAIANYLMIFPRVYGKHRRYQEELARSGTSFMAQEHLERFKFSYMLMLHCTIVWFILVFMYFFNMAAHRLLPVGHVFRTDALAMIVDTVFDVIAKAVYMKLIVDVHFAVFDNEGRAQRQLAELRTLMSVLWDSSSDAIIISARRGDRVTSMLSPAFLRLAQVTLPPDVRGFKSVALLIETKLPEEDGATAGSGSSKSSRAKGGILSGYNDVLSCTYVDCSENPYDGLFDESVLAEVSSASAHDLQASGLISASWRHAMREEKPPPERADKSDAQGAPANDAAAADGTPASTGQGENADADDSNILVYQFHQRQCEIKVSANDDKNTMVAVVRDVTERHKRLEAERKAHSEIAMRQKDAQSQTRFVRHEVKNGLLVGIELCDTLRNAVDDLERTMEKVHRGYSRSSSDAGDVTPSPPGPGVRIGPDDSRHSNSGTASASASVTATDRTDAASTKSDEDRSAHGVSARPRKLMEELDVTLHEVLDTVLAEAMARDVIHEVYQPRKERLDVLGLFTNSGSKAGKAERFPVVVAGGRNDIPYLMLDPQLLRYIHRNAISNACKYGAQGGKVLTELSFDTATNTFQMQVMNDPGPGHERLMALGDTASENVFRQGSMLHLNDGNNRSSYISSGDGAWIMQKCAKTMRGACVIDFLPDKTVFTFNCPAEPLCVVEWPDTHDFQVPAGTWGIAVDDSKIQRKLMARILGHVGVEESRRIILGSTPAEVFDVGRHISQVLEEPPATSKVLILVDENLDFGETEGHPVVLSGSVIMKDVLAKLTPDEERRTFVLVRSANDSADDVALYMRRTHGFFPKAPMQRQRIRELLAPLWAERFLNLHGGADP